MVQSVVVIGGNDAIMLGVIRSLGSCGYKVIVLHVGAHSRRKLYTQLDYYSRYVVTYYSCSKNDPQALIDTLLPLGNTSQKPVLITLDDLSTSIIDGNLRQLEGLFRFGHIRHEEGAIVGLMNKHLQKELARSVGFQVVSGWPIYYERGRYIIPDGIEYPCFVKGLNSYNSSKKHQRRCEDKDDLVAHLEKCAETTSVPMYAESYIETEKELGVLGFCMDGNGDGLVLAELIEMGKGSFQGVSMFGKVSMLDKSSGLAEKIWSLLNHIGYTGIFNLDIVESDGKLYFIELNFRYAAYGYASSLAGYNIPSKFAQMMFDERNSISPDCSFKPSFYFNDKIGLLSAIDKSLSLKEYRAFRRKADYSLVNSWSDPKPSVVFYLRGIFSYVLTRIQEVFRV